jgi:co-chaperonin GroES (HSP10)
VQSFIARVEKKRVVRHIKPLGPRVLVRIIHEEDVSDSGLYLPPGARERLQEALYGEVVEVARAAPENPAEDGFGANVAGVPDGARVLFSKSAGVAVPWDDDLRLLESKEILATVDEVSADEIS